MTGVLVACGRLLRGGSNACRVPSRKKDDLDRDRALGCPRGSPVAGRLRGGLPWVSGMDSGRMGGVRGGWGMSFLERNSQLNVNAGVTPALGFNCATVCCA